MLMNKNQIMLNQIMIRMKNEIMIRMNQINKTLKHKQIMKILQVIHPIPKTPKIMSQKNNKLIQNNPKIPPQQKEIIMMKILKEENQMNNKIQ